MKRRTVIKQVLCITGAAILLPYCSEEKKSSLVLKKIRINSKQEALMTELAETIIPSTDTPGAKDIAAHHFVLLMVDDCYSLADQQKFIKGLEAFELKLKDQFNKSLSACSPYQKETLLLELEEKKVNGSELSFFYKTVKSLTIQAFTTSKLYLTDVRNYRMIQGHFYGCVPVKG
ncbi:MAG: gluconate 2-dehydrogenase subunit 3 family protein [Ferruginibacter sp.]